MSCDSSVFVYVINVECIFSLAFNITPGLLQHRETALQSSLLTPRTRGVGHERLNR